MANKAPKTQDVELEAPAGSAPVPASLEAVSRNDGFKIVSVADNGSYQQVIARLEQQERSAHLRLVEFACEYENARSPEEREKIRAEYLAWRVELDFLPRRLGHLNVADTISRYVPLREEIAHLEREIEAIPPKREAAVREAMGMTGIDLAAAQCKVEAYDREIQARREKVEALRKRLDDVEVFEHTNPDDEHTWPQRYVSKAEKIARWHEGLLRQSMSKYTSVVKKPAYQM